MPSEAKKRKPFGVMNQKKRRLQSLQPAFPHGFSDENVLATKIKLCGLGDVALALRPFGSLALWLFDSSASPYTPMQLCVVSVAAMAVRMVTMRLSRVFHLSLFMAPVGLLVHYSDGLLSTSMACSRLRWLVHGSGRYTLGSETSFESTTTFLGASLAVTPSSRYIT